MGRSKYNHSRQRKLPVKPIKPIKPTRHKKSKPVGIEWANKQWTYDPSWFWWPTYY